MHRLRDFKQHIRKYELNLDNMQLKVSSVYTYHQQLTTLLTLF
jgi:hypothetical protein